MVQTKKKYNITLFILLLILSAAIMIPVFYAGNFLMRESDFPPHYVSAMELFSINREDFSFPIILAYPTYHIILKGIAEFLKLSLSLATTVSYKTASIIMGVVFNLFTVFIVRKIFRVLVNTNDTKKLYLIDLLSAGSIFFIGICGPLTNGTFYLPQGAPNVWHNPTTLFVRPFGLLAFYSLIVIFNNYKSNNKNLKALVLFSVASGISCLAKPSFAFVLLPAAAIVTLVVIFQDFKTNFKKFGLPLLIAALPSAFILLAQYLVVADAWVEYEVETFLKFGSQFEMTFTQSIFSTISLMLIVVFVLCATGYRFVKTNPEYMIAVLAAFVGWLQYYFIYQTGPAAGDFFWGYSLGVHLATIVSLALVMQFETRKPIVFATFSIFSVQLFFGLWYVYKIIFEQAEYFI